MAIIGGIPHFQTYPHLKDEPSMSGHFIASRSSISLKTVDLKESLHRFGMGLGVVHVGQGKKQLLEKQKITEKT